MNESPFSKVPPEDWIACNDLAFAIRDRFPVSEGHALLITRRVVPTWFDATPEEQAAILRLMDEVKQLLDSGRKKPDGYNVGFNAGLAAGQTVMHLHVHVIPRYLGDMEDPRGGVRHVVPSRGNYVLPASAKRPLQLTDGHGVPLSAELLTDLDESVRADLAVAFILPSGLRGDVLPRLRDVLRRSGSRVRVITGDYQDVTDPRALRELLMLQEESVAFDAFQGRMEVRVFESSRAGRAFHPKAYLLYADANDTLIAGYVGSSNLSHSALYKGIEWNVRVPGSAENAASLRLSFDNLFAHPCAVPLSAEWIRRYEYRRRPPVAGGRPGTHEVDVAPEVDAPTSSPAPHSIQAEALAALSATREAGNLAALVVLATGLGKTWLAAFDSAEDRGFKRVLFVAHRDEILEQAAETFGLTRPNDTCGFYTGQTREMAADIVLASVQTLSRAAHLSRFTADEFDYVIIDEFHHADAASYRKVIDYFAPKFLLGLTATPHRADGGDLLALCNQNLAYACNLVRGINEHLLAPFHYYGVADNAQYPNIPWRSLDEEAITNAVATHARAENAFEQWRDRAGKRTVAFCVSRRHADFMREFFRAQGLRVASVHSGGTSDPRTTSLQALERGELDVLFCVDMFNEGVDVPSIDTVLMLRPTESKVVWLQQLGRGLRRCEGKTHLVVIDYIGNHRVFLNKPEALLEALGFTAATKREVLKALRERRFEGLLPPGCEVTYDLESIDILESLFPPTRGAERIREWYEEFREYNGRRPSALEAYQSSFNLNALRREYGSWFGFVAAMGDLDEGESTVWQADRQLLTVVETTQLTRSYKLLVLRAMLLRGTLPGRITLPDLAGTIASIAAKSSRLRQDITADLDDGEAVERLMVKYPLPLLAKEGARNSAPVFALSADAFGTTDAVKSSLGSALPRLVDELVAWRLAEYLDRTGEAAVLKVTHNASDNPIVSLDRARNQVPEGWTEVTIEGVSYELNFAKAFVNVARVKGTGQNVLPELLRRWFGEEAGASGRRSAVRHLQVADGLRWEPVISNFDATPSVSSGTQIIDDNGVALDARYRIEERIDTPTLVYMSRGDGRNEQYNKGLELLLTRFGAIGALIDYIELDSGGVRQIATEGRRLALEGFTYPIALGAAVNVEELRKTIGRAAAAAGRKPAATGAGNSTKRLRFTISGVTIAEVERALLRDSK